MSEASVLRLASLLTKAQQKEVLQLAAAIEELSKIPANLCPNRAQVEA